MNRAILLMVAAGVASVSVDAQAKGPYANHRGKKARADRSPRTMVAVENLRPEPVRVYVDGRFIGQLDPQRALRRYLRAGSRSVEVRNLDGAVLTRSERLFRPNQLATLAVEVQPARVALRNESGVPITITAGREVLASLDPGQRARVELAPGRHYLQASYQQHGMRQVLVADLMELAEGDSTSLPLTAPTHTLVSVTNDLGRRAQLQIDGEAGPWMAPGEQALVEVPVGLVSLRMMRHGSVADVARVMAQPSTDAAWVAEGARRSSPVAGRWRTEPTVPVRSSSTWWAEAAPEGSFLAPVLPSPRQRYHDDDDDDDDDDEREERRTCRSC